jgi:hypothetical protein
LLYDIAGILNHSSRPVKYWAYKAIKADYTVVEGVSTGASFLDLAVRLRREQGLQVIEAKTITPEIYTAEARLAKLRSLLKTDAPYQPPTTIRRIWLRIISLFLRG